MNSWNLALQIGMGLVFLIWAFEMFRMLFRIWGRANRKRDETGGGYFDWAGHSLSGYGWFFTAPETRSHRNRVLALTALVIAMVILRTLMIAPAG